MLIELVLIGLALAMDCFAVSVASGVVVRKHKTGTILRMAFLFGLFQALMPVLGWLLASRFQSAIEAYDHWIAFGMLAFIGGKLIVESFKEEDAKTFDPEGFKQQVLLAVATSIDALAVGVTFACTGYADFGSLILPVCIIGLLSFLMSVLGFCLGVRWGDAVNKKVHPELLGGLILIAIGIKILIEHLFC